MKRALSICTPAEWACLLVVALPWLIAPWPMGTDLPQHAAQIELLTRAWAGDPELRIAWFGSNTLVYWPLAAAIRVFGPVGGTKVLSWLLVSAAALLSFRLCRSRGTPVTYGVIAAVLLFNSNLYWGFLNFQLGWAVYLGWLILMLSPAPNTWRRLTLLGAVHVLLLAAHSLWFAAAGLSGLVLLLARRTDFRTRLLRGLTAVPAAGLAAWWVPRVLEQRTALGFDMDAQWLVPTGERLTGDFLGAAAFGNVAGSYLVVVALVTAAAFVLTSLLGNSVPTDDPAARRPAFDRELLGIAALGAVALFVLPNKHANTLDFARRWVPYTCVLLLLSRPTLGLSWRGASGFSRAIRLAALAPVLTCSVWTAVVWSRVASDELAGFSRSLDAIGSIDAPRTLGLNDVPVSRYLRGSPYMQMFAWSQAIHGGTLNFSFTEHQSGVVVDRHPVRHPWTLGLEWTPSQVTDRDIAYFDVVLLSGSARLHRNFAGRENLEELTSDGVWRAYRVKDSLPR